LSDTQIRRAKATDKPLKFFNRGGLYLQLLPTGDKSWRFLFWQAYGKENSVTFSPHLLVILAEARAKRDEARRLMVDGTGPVQHREHCRLQQAA
jgi:hypothetical protein